MNNKKLTILAVIAIAMVAWAVIQVQIANRPVLKDQMPGYLIGGIETNSIASIRIEGADETISLVRNDKGWVVGTKENYPAIGGEINGILTACMDLKPAEIATDSAVNHEDLGVSDSKKRYKVTLFDQETKPITGFYLSDSDPETQNVYARKLDSDKVYRLKEDNWPYLSTMSFIEKELTKVEKDNISSVTVTSPEGAYTLAKGDGEDAKVTLAEMPAGKQLKGTTHQRVFEALTSLSFDDVLKDDEKTRDLAFDTKYVCTLADTTVYTFEMAKKDDKYYARCTARFLDTSDVSVARDDSDEELKKKEAKLLANKNAGDFARKHQGWTYEIASYTAENLTKKLEDLLEDIPEEKPAETTDSTPDTTPVSDVTDPVSQPPVTDPNSN